MPKTIHLSTGESRVSNLYVCRYPFAQSTWREWRLVYGRPGDDSYVCAEGECSARYFATMAEAIAYGRRAYGEEATRWVWGGDFPQPKEAEAVP